MRKNFYLNIQLFAESEVTDETPTEEVENNEEAETSENAEADTDTKDNDKGEAEKKAKSDEDKKRKQNSENAQRRIQERLEKQEKENQRKLERAKRESYIDGVKKSTNGINKFTEKPIVDEDDVEEYEIMLELERKGKDPIADYYEAVKEKTRAQRQKREAEEKAKAEEEKFVNDDISNFRNKYGEETLQKLTTDEKFSKFADLFLGKKSTLADVYEGYLQIQAEIEAKAKDKVIEKESRRASSPGAPGKANETPKSLKDMTKEERHKYIMEIAGRY